ncbi:hypothetical protein EPA93_22515 [Ktedonosporobacter rubrisoli]|uniref:Uncharacterized protein n=1 Tax=Ktedonosporobacter rubrisoli TaxID=2509675 RepID=A0A4P6JTG8_KTERU|nr:hypothetical protein [Ktedonosporobacter rubrisoli]QBD78615.1 hypothetical protein EPA93_22515 [Ktedonosporobacter rubrisoli]
MSQTISRYPSLRVGPLQLAIILLAIVTGLVHLYRGIAFNLFLASQQAIRAGARAPVLPYTSIPIPTLFILNFIGYIVLVTALYLPPLRQYQRIIRWVLIAYAAITIIAWILITHAHFDLVAYLDKPIELLLIVLLFIEGRRTQQAKG